MLVIFILFSYVFFFCCIYSFAGVMEGWKTFLSSPSKSVQHLPPSFKPRLWYFTPWDVLQGGVLARRRAIITTSKRRIQIAGQEVEVAGWLLACYVDQVLFLFIYDYIRLWGNRVKSGRGINMGKERERERNLSTLLRYVACALLIPFSHINRGFFFPQCNSRALFQLIQTCGTLCMTVRVCFWRASVSLWVLLA